MAYALSYKTVRDKATLYAVIQDRETSLFWDEDTDTWVEDIVDGCNLALTESADKGVYTAEATFAPVNGGVYQISVYDSADAEYIMDTIEVYPSKTKTVLNIINAVQTELRMPNSAAITDTLSRLILAKMNTVLTVLLPQNNVFSHLKVQGSFTINSSRPFYRVNPVNVDFVDSITFLRKPDLSYINEANDDIHFRQMADAHNASLTYAAPVWYRISQRDHGFPIVEFTPAPDQAYIVSYEVLKAAKELTAATDYVPMPDVIKAGALMLMKKDMGRDATTDEGIYAVAMERASTVGANSNMKDFVV